MNGIPIPIHLHMEVQGLAQIEISPPSNILVDAGDQGALWHGSNHRVLLLTVLEYHHGGDAPDAQLGRDVGVLISV